jgi:hypothetical protein
MACSERLPTRLNPLAERACFSFPLLHLIFSYYAEGCVASCVPQARGHVRLRRAAAAAAPPAPAPAPARLRRGPSAICLPHSRSYGGSL